MTDIDIIRALREWNAGLPLAQIAASQGAAQETMRRWIIKAGGKPRRKERADRMHLDTEAIVAAYQGGKGLADLAKEHHVCPGTITKCLEEAGIKRRPRGHNQHGKWADLGQWQL